MPLVLLLFFCCLSASASPLDSLEQRLRQHPQIQEKVYVHTDNSCYFIGDTLWYKAYVLRADSLCPTDMSRLLYVELLSPDGLVVARQRIVVADQGYSCGQFALPDSLYSGYYELRAYTRWMLNFNVSSRSYTRDDRHRFYNDRMAADYYRDWDDLYSRVLPVYERPAEPGNYTGRYMAGRPKMEMSAPARRELHCAFYPEGGLLVEGLRSRVAFELTNQDGQAVSLAGRLSGQGEPVTVQTVHMGRGTFDLTPAAGRRAELSFVWLGKTYAFPLPRAGASGAVVRRGRGLHFSLQSTPDARPASWAVLCRGRLCLFGRLPGAAAGGPAAAPTAGSATPVEIVPDERRLPSGVNELQVYDAQGCVLASRLFFVNHHDRALPLRAATDKADYAPYEAVDLTLSAPPEAQGATVSVSVRDSRTDDTTYDDGDLLASMLLCSDLRGFVASPAYYFAADDEEHREALDLLMLVQGWRKYSRFERTASTAGLGRLVPTPLRYEPETALTVEGSVNKQLSVEMLRLTDVEGLNNRPGVAEKGLRQAEEAVTTGGVDAYGRPVVVLSGGAATEGSDALPAGGDVSAGIADRGNGSGGTGATTDAAGESAELKGDLGVNHGGLKHEVLVEGELVKDGQVAGLTQLTHDGGRFTFRLPPYYDRAVLFLTAYEPKDSARRALSSRRDKHRFDEEAYPAFYVKRDLFYPVFARPYSFYQTHLPDLLLPSDTVSAPGMAADHTLSTVKVEARRRSRRAMDYNSPAYVVDAYDLYNEATDRGLSWGVPNMGTFPPVACLTVYGNMNRRRDYNVLGKLDDYTFFQNFSSVVESVKNRTPTSVFADLHLKRIRNFRFYTDYEPRRPADPHTEELNQTDVAVVYELIPGDGTRHTYRDRRYLLPGIERPLQHYSPDYSRSRPAAPTDYRRTLYWNPNARLDANGEFRAILYNGSRPSRLRVSAAGVTAQGKMLGGR